MTLLVAPSICLANDVPSPCLIEPSQRIAIRSTVSATIAAVHVERGSVVKKGQPLVTLDSSVEAAALASAKYRSVMQGQVAAAEARMVHSRDKSGRREELMKQSYVSAQDRDDAIAELRVAEADLLEARDSRELASLEVKRLTAEVARRVILSPIDGVVTDRLLHPGELAQIGESAGPILKLAQTDPARVEVVLPVARYGRARVGSSFAVKPEPPFSGTYNAVVKVVDSVVDSASGTFGVRLEFNNPNGRVPLGVRCTVVL